MNSPPTRPENQLRLYLPWRATNGPRAKKPLEKALPGSEWTVVQEAPLRELNLTGSSRPGSLVISTRRTRQNQRHAHVHEPRLPVGDGLVQLLEPGPLVEPDGPCILLIDKQ